MRTEMQEPEKIDPKTFHPNTASNEQLGEHVDEEASTKAVITLVKAGGKKKTTYAGVTTSKLKAPRKIM
jgi:hypothetical protein